MLIQTRALSFTVNPAKGAVKALHQVAEHPIARFVFGHGAGANMQHAHMQQLADVLSSHGIETLRYNFPYMQAGGGRTDSLPVCLDTIDNALKLAAMLAPNLPVFLCGHSFGGRMNSHYAATETSNIAGLVYFSFPLHPSKKPDVKRAAHLPDIHVPQLFVSGTRDTLATLGLLEPIIETLPLASLHKIDTADHGLKTLKRTRQSSEDAYSEAGRVVGSWTRDILAQELGSTVHTV